MSLNIDTNAVLKYLNSNLDFEFYEFKLNDVLEIRLEYKHPEIYNKSYKNGHITYVFVTDMNERRYHCNYISFRFENEWKINDSFDCIDKAYEEISEGYVVNKSLPNHT